MQSVRSVQNCQLLKKLKYNCLLLFPFLFIDVANYQVFAVSWWTSFLTQFDIFKVSPLGFGTLKLIHYALVFL